MEINENWYSYVPIDPKEEIPKTEYVLSKKEWDEMQARIEELEALVEKAFREGDNESGGPLGLDPWEGSYAKEVLDKIKGTEDDG